MTAEPDFKGLLQSHCQKAKVGLPQYTCIQSSRNNRAFFNARVTVMGNEFSSEAEFSSKKQAEKNAAKVALFQLRILSTAIKLNNYSSCGPANITSGSESDELYEQKEGQVFSGSSSVLGETPEESHKEDFSVPVCPSEGQGTLKVLTPEAERPLLSSITSNLVSGKSNAPLSYKNILQEKAQKMGLALPHYETTREADGFVCTVIFNGQPFKSDRCSPNKKMAQQNAASRAIQVLTGEQTQKETLLSGIQTVPTISPSAAIEDIVNLSYKNLLQENCQQRGHRCPAYSTSWQGSGFVSVVQVGDKTASSKVPYETKKRAEQMAAREALLLAGVHNPEDAYKNRGKSKEKLKRSFAPEAEFNAISLGHCHGGYGMAYPNHWGEVDYNLEKGIVSKRLKLDTSDCHANFGGNNEARTINLPQDHRQDFTVAEIWKEKKNIVIVGHEETSFVLYCTIIPGTCNLFNNRTMSLILLQPGYRIIGLDAQYSHHNGKVALQAERCADVIIPETPDPVLTSCGVVLLYQDPQSDSLQVLLKRYLSSQAFVNVAAALAQYFRRSVSGRHAWLDTESITEHIRDWMLEEVQSIANMNREALQQVFTCMWKFNERWCSVLDHPLPKDLELLKARANDELARRQASDTDHSEDYYHPWGLPKGNFKHRMLSTGLFIETPADCAVRELKEETGIKLDADNIKNCSQIDLPHIDNLNPHKGDMVKYFLHMYGPEDKDVELNVSYELEQMNTSLEFETEQDIFSESPCLGFSPASEQQAEDKGQNEWELRYTADICVGLDRKAKQDNMERSPAKQMENCASRQNYRINEVLEENSGIKRKYTDDDDEQSKRTMPLEIKEPEESPHSSGQPKISSSIVYTPGRSKEMMVNRRSPRVQGSVHEECAWFTVDEARRKSPAFQQIYETQQFKNLLTLTTKQL